jgi:DNA-binding transcriptional regulator GbsR (MarR family)
MPVDVERAVGEVFSRKHAPKIYAAIATLAKDRFSTTELVAASGVSQSYVSKELKILGTVGLVIVHGQNDYERVPDAFWRPIAELVEAWHI